MLTTAIKQVPIFGHVMDHVLLLENVLEKGLETTLGFDPIRGPSPYRIQHLANFHALVFSQELGHHVEDHVRDGKDGNDFFFILFNDGGRARPRGLFGAGVAWCQR